MIKQQNLKCDIETLQESINRKWCELSQTNETEELTKIREQLGFYHDELKILITQIL